MPVITGFLARTFAGFLNILTGFAFWGSTPDGVVEPGIVVGMGLLVSATSFVIMAVLLYVAHHHYCNCLRSVFSSCRRRYMLTLTLFMSKRSAVFFCRHVPYVALRLAPPAVHTSFSLRFRFARVTCFMLIISPASVFFSVAYR